MTAPSCASRRRYWRKLLLTTVILLLVAIIGTPSLAGFMMTYAMVYGPCVADPTTPGNFGLAYEDLTIDASAGGQFDAFFIPGSTRAAIIIPPTMRGGRGNRLHLADLYARHGYAVLTFDSRRCADMGPLSLGYAETEEVGDALAYLLARDDVDPTRIGITGFSSAGATAVMSTALYPDLRAVVAEGGYGDFAEGAIGLGTGGDNVLEAIFKWSLGASYRILTGVNINKLSPQDMIGAIAPRPILLIYGTEERSLAGAYDQLAVAGDNAELWVIKGAGHGHYLDVAPEEYEQRVIAFFDKALLSAEH
ncbi:MAG: prolyl oligopeptidase family serine peptidase [Anaerolineae bacterium]|nr:prolyl oligopeptidase family serine peptidase [Anaerolineae bacterium]